MPKFKLVRGQKSGDNENLERIDFNIWVALIFLCCFGLIMVLSASSFECASSSDFNYDALYYFKRQALFVVLGFAGILVLRHYDYRKLKYFSTAAYVISIFCIFLLLTPLGISVNGAKRWLGRGSVRFQVAEVVKISVILFLASFVTNNSKQLGKIPMTILLWVLGAIPAGLLFVISNDLSSAIIVLGITFGISFVCAKTVRLHIGMLCAVIAAAGLYVLNIWNHLPTPEELEHTSFRIGRIAAWLAPERYSDNQGYQILQALYAVGNGGLLGRNLGNSIQKLYAIPEAHTDMIFSIVCEELGLIGATLLISLFLYLLYQLLRLALSTRELYGSVIVLGIFLHISIQTVINLAVNVNLFPNTGLTLPFISYGGTSVFLLLIEMSIVFSIIQIRTSGDTKPLPERYQRPSRLTRALMVLVSGSDTVASRNNASKRSSGTSASRTSARTGQQSRTSSSGRTSRSRTAGTSSARTSRSQATGSRTSKTRSSSSRNTTARSTSVRSSNTGRAQNSNGRYIEDDSHYSRGSSSQSRSSRTARFQSSTARNVTTRSRTSDYSSHTRNSQNRRPRPRS